MSSRKPRVVCLGTPKYIDQDYLAEFKKGFDFDIFSVSNRHDFISELPRFIADEGPIDAFVIRMGRGPYSPFNEELLSPLLPHCRIIASASAGYDDVDLEWLTKNQVWFCNTVDSVAESTADLTIFLILAVVRDTYRGELGARDGKTWKSLVMPSRDPRGMTLGIVGMGSVGRYLAKKAAVFGMKVVYHNRSRLDEVEEKDLNATYCPTLHSLLSRSDVISINCPLTPSTRNLISTAEFSAMKNGGVFLVNTSRGEVVDETALKAALESGKVTRAGLDVFWNEPNIDDYWRKSDKVIIQPHVGGMTDLAFGKSEEECLENVRALFEKGRPVEPVNEVE